MTTTSATLTVAENVFGRFSNWLVNALIAEFAIDNKSCDAAYQAASGKIMLSDRILDLHSQGMTPARLVLSIVCLDCACQGCPNKTRRFARVFLFVAPP
jgi:hypothetical protein